MYSISTNMFSLRETCYLIKEDEMKKSGKKLVSFLMTLSLIIGSIAIQPVSSDAAGKKATSIKLSATSKTLYAGKTFTLKVKSVKPSNASKAVTWSSSNKKVAIVTSKGKVTAKSAGTAKITAVSKTNKKAKATCTVKVKSEFKPTPTIDPTQTTEPADKPAAIVHSGTFEKTSWTLDEEGLLVVKGFGDMFSHTAEFRRPEWLGYFSDIKFARIEVTGATHLDNLFSSCYNLRSVDLTQLDTTLVTDISRMFSGCTSLKEVDLSRFNTYNVENMSGLFSGCSSLTSINLSPLNTINTKNMSAMFEDCSSLTSINLSGFNTSNVEDMSSMFAGCSGLKSLDVSPLDTASVTNMGSMFAKCSGLSAIDLSSFDASNVDSMYEIFEECNGLTTIITPMKTSDYVSNLPDGIWFDEDNNIYRTLPERAKRSITLMLK